MICFWQVIRDEQNEKNLLVSIAELFKQDSRSQIRVSHDKIVKNGINSNKTVIQLKNLGKSLCRNTKKTLEWQDDF